MKHSHTKGPWRWISPNSLVQDKDGRPVVLTTDLGTPLIENAIDGGTMQIFDHKGPNGCLIEAAPLLYEAIEFLLSEIFRANGSYLTDEAKRRLTEAMHAARVKS